jgi:hypothetical protein
MNGKPKVGGSVHRKFESDEEEELTSDRVLFYQFMCPSNFHERNRFR